MMAHAVYIDDAYGDLIDLRTYCSDFCAQTDNAYAGWNGCIEYDFDTYCEDCGRFIPGTQGEAP
jgi:hypothetical protein